MFVRLFDFVKETDKEHPSFWGEAISPLLLRLRKVTMDILYYFQKYGKQSVEKFRKKPPRDLPKEPEKRVDMLYCPFFDKESIYRYFHHEICKDDKYQEIVKIYFKNRSTIETLINKIPEKLQETVLRGKISFGSFTVDKDSEVIIEVSFFNLSPYEIGRIIKDQFGDIYKLAQKRKDECSKKCYIWRVKRYLWIIFSYQGSPSVLLNLINLDKDDLFYKDIISSYYF